MKKPQKVENLLEKIRNCIEDGNFLDTYHSTTRKVERNITRPEILYVLKNGNHEKAKDEFQERYKSWNYAIRGKTLDERLLRIIVSFDENGMLIITAIDLKA